MVVFRVVNTSLRTGEVARLAGVNVETLRFYEREGILAEPPRRASAYREYPPETIDLVQFVKRAQEVGFSLREVRGLLALHSVPARAPSKVRRLVQSNLADIEHKIRDLEAMRRVLNDLLCACQENGRPASGPIIEALSGCPSCDERGAGLDT